MSDYFTDDARWEQFLNNLAPWQRDTITAIENFRFSHLGQRVARSDIFACLKDTDLEIENPKWIEKYMEYLCILGFASPVWGGWVFGREY